MSGETPVFDRVVQREDVAATFVDSANWMIRVAQASEVGTAVGIDDDACHLFGELGGDFALGLPDYHPFVVAEGGRWLDAARAERIHFACAADGSPIGFAVLGFIDGKPYLDQLSVRRTWMNLGVGGALMRRALRWSAPSGALWLTTYGSVPWNGPWYARLGFVAIPDSAVGPELRATLAFERTALPNPQDRVAMVYRHRDLDENPAPGH